MELSTSNRAKIRVIKEAVFATIPGAGNPKDVRFTGESLAYAIQTTKSAEIRSDRMTADLPQVGASTSGDINFELSYKEYDDLMEAALEGTWLGANDLAVPSVTITLTNTITASAGTPFAGVVVGQKVKFSGFANAQNNSELTVLTASPTVITVAGTPLVNEAAVPVTFSSFGKTTLSMTTTLGTTLTAASGAPFANVVAGQRIKISGMPTAANNKVVTVVSKTSPQVLVFAAATFSNETGPTTTVSSSRLMNGVLQVSWGIERALTDINQFFFYRGMTVSKMSLDFASGSIVTGSFGFMGRDGVRNATTQMPGVPITSQTFDVTNAVSGVGTIMENGAALTSTFIKSLKLNVDNSLRARDGLGVLGAVSVASGSLGVSGNMMVYLADGTLYDKFIGNTASSLSWTVQDGAGNGYSLHIPRLKYGDAKVQAGSKDTDVMLDMPFESIIDPTTNAMVIIDRFGV